jgi:flagellar hook-associated protein 3 FlgL
MRITNKMMTNNMMSNINKNKVNLTNLEQQYSSGKKIQRPSDDPIVTVRALKLRTNLSELKQYSEKNIPDAKSWMEVTESALKTVNELLRQINTYCVQGSSDTLTSQDRSAIVANLTQMKAQIYQEGNANFAGRYVFTGYKTDSPLLFTADEPDLSYTITENIDTIRIQKLSKISGSYELADFENPAIDFTKAPKMEDTYRIQLAYDKLDQQKPDMIRLFKKNDNGQLEETTAFVNLVSISAADPKAYAPDDEVAHYLPETGEIILGKEVYEELRKTDQMVIEYSKTGFEKGSMKPEHYFNCVMKDNSKPELPEVTYTKNQQQILYEVNYNQKLAINTEGSDAITHNIGRCIDDILNAVNSVVLAEEKIAEVEKRLADAQLPEADRERYNKLKGQLETELVLKKEAMQLAFSNGIKISSEEQDRVNTAVADLGSRYVRLELTENRLSSQKVDFEELLSENEDVDMVDTIIKYNAAETLYNASLSAASKVVQKTLLDFIQ